ncbi:glycosyltransferase [Mycobacterium sp. NPDC050441]|uniref:glycosyltransferase n=1 Tax=Mycobacterium sp. NPDC050441 TaxID=3155403 RepID=UPI0033D2976A
MKVLQVLTLMSPDGAYGGPARVALNQCAALAEAGHQPILLAGTHGYSVPPQQIDGTPVRLFRARRVLPRVGYAATWAPAMVGWLRRHGSEFDVVHVHLARDLVTIPAARTALRLGLPVVVQTHGMIVSGTHPLAAPIDALWTKKLLGSAGAVFYLNDAERAELSVIGGPGLRLEPLANGVPLESDVRSHQRTQPPEVLFLARLHKRKRPDVFAAAALELLRRGTDAQFALVGPPEGAEAAVDRIIAEARADGFGESRLRREPAVAPGHAGERMRTASVYALPAVREPFGMSIIEALAESVPVVINADGGLADFVERSRCGAVVAGGPHDYAGAIARLLADPVTARTQGAAGRAAVRATYGMEPVRQKLEDVYGGITLRMSK